MKLFVVKITDGGASPTLKWGQWLGLIGYSPTYGVTCILAINEKNCGIYVSGGIGGGAFTWETERPHEYGTNSGGGEVFIIRVTDTITTSRLDWIQWLGGEKRDFVHDLVVNKVNNSIYVGGGSFSSNPWAGEEKISWQTLHSGNDEGFVVKIIDNFNTTTSRWEPNLGWGQWLGGKEEAERVSCLAVRGNSIYAGGWTTGYTSWLGETAIKWNSQTPPDYIGGGSFCRKNY